MKLHQNRAVAGTLVAVLLVLATGYSTAQPSTPASSKAVVTLKLGHGLEPVMPLHSGALKLAELAHKKTNGSLKIQVFPSGQLGMEKELTEGTQMGSIDMSLVSSGALGRFAPMQNIAYAPYLFRDFDHFMKVYRSPIADEMAKQLLDKTGIRTLDLAWYYGIRHLTTKNTPVKVPADLKGLKVRTPNIPLMRDAIAAWGVSVTTMDPSELYSALQTGVVSGQENPPSSIYGWKLYEVQKYLILTGHMMGNMNVLINDKVYQKLSPDHQKALQEAVWEAAAFQNELTVNMDKENLEKLKKAGMIVIQPRVDDFRKLSASIIPQYEQKWGVGLYEKIQDIK